MLKPDSQPTVLERGIALSGDRAAGWLSERGWLTSRSDPETRVAGDMMRTAQFTLARMWHSSADLVWRPSHAHEFSAIFAILGQAELLVGEESLTLTQGGGVLFSTGSPPTISSAEPLAFVDLRPGGRFLERFGLALPGEFVLSSSDSRPGRTLIGLANNALTNSYKDDPTWYLQEAALENLMAAVLIDATHRSDPPRNSRDQLLRRAERIIVARSSRPGFGVTDLAAELGASKRTLQLAFADAGTTARQVIRRVRAQNARKEIERRGSMSASDMAEVAMMVGFPNVRALRGALEEAAGSADEETSHADPPAS